MRRQLYVSVFRVGSWRVHICWDVIRLAYRWWTKGRYHGTVLWSPSPLPRYNVAHDHYQIGILLGPIAAWRDGWIEVVNG